MSDFKVLTEDEIDDLGKAGLLKYVAKANKNGYSIELDDDAKAPLIRAEILKALRSKEEMSVLKFKSEDELDDMDRDELYEYIAQLNHLRVDVSSLDGIEKTRLLRKALAKLEKSHTIRPTSPVKPMSKTECLLKKSADEVQKLGKEHGVTGSKEQICEIIAKKPKSKPQDTSCEILAPNNVSRCKELKKSNLEELKGMCRASKAKYDGYSVHKQKDELIKFMIEKEADSSSSSSTSSSSTSSTATTVESEPKKPVNESAYDKYLKMNIEDLRALLKQKRKGIINTSFVKEPSHAAELLISSEECYGDNLACKDGEICDITTKPGFCISENKKQSSHPEWMYKNKKFSGPKQIRDKFLSEYKDGDVVDSKSSPDKDVKVKLSVKPKKEESSKPKKIEIPKSPEPKPIQTLKEIDQAIKQVSGTEQIDKITDVQKAIMKCLGINP